VLACGADSEQWQLLCRLQKGKPTGQFKPETASYFCANFVREKKHTRKAQKGTILE
jgi:hypothetical protein